LTGWSDLGRALTGRDKRAVAAEAGASVFRAWRRSFAVAPPAMSEDAAAVMYADDRYADLDPGALPRTENLADTWARMLPYWPDVCCLWCSRAPRRWSSSTATACVPS
jgi:2,3-bisphosphoglycerate-dependent phosphoglycerate mutase